MSEKNQPPVQVTDDIHLIRVPMKGMPPASVYVVSGSKLTIIDTGPASGNDIIINGLTQLRYEPSAVRHIILTHIHIDHGGGIGALARKLPQATVMVHPLGARHLIDPSRLVASTRLTYGNDFEEFLGPLLPVPEKHIHILRDGEIISPGNRNLKVLFTPGHAPHHLSIWDSTSRTLFAGEALGIPVPDAGTIVPSASPPAFDLEEMLNSIDILRKLEPARLLFGHNGFSEDVERLMVLARKNTIACNEALLRSARTGKKPEEMSDDIKACICNHHLAGFDFDFSPQIAGYLHYFKKKGLL